MLITYPCANSSLGVLDGVLLLSVNVDKAHRIRHPIAVTKSEKVMNTDINNKSLLTVVEALLLPEREPEKAV